MEFKCDSCDAVYLSKKAMIRHQKEKHGEKTFVCSICQKTFTSKRYLSTHMTTHSDKLFECSYCGKPFSRKFNKDRHEETHKNQPSFDCADCDASFHCLSDLSKHHRDVHREKQPSKKRKSPTKEASSNKRTSKKTKTDDVDPAVFHPSIVSGVGFTPEMKELYQNNWPRIRTVSKTNRHIEDTYNFRITSGHANADMQECIRDVFAKQEVAFKIGQSFGCVLINTKTGELRYFYSCRNNHCVLKSPVLIANRQDLTTYLETIHDLGLQGMAMKRRENSDWVLEHITNVTSYVDKIASHPIGAPVELPEYLMNNKGLNPLVKNRQTGKQYVDYKCLFRCYALHLGYPIKGLEKMTNQLLNAYLQHYEVLPRYFRGITLEKMVQFEDLFKVNIMVYQLKQEDGKYTAKLIRRSMEKYEDTMNINLYDKHASYIRDMAVYAHSWKCENCKSFFDRSNNLHHHIKTCTLEPKEKFPGGAFSVPATVFEDLDDIGISVPLEDRTCRHFAAFDFESYLLKMLEERSPKLKWIGEHCPISVSVCSSVSKYRKSRCMVSSGTSNELIDRFLDYLLDISQESYTVLRQKFDYVFKELEKRKTKELVKQPDESDDDFEKRHKKNYLTKLHRRLDDYLLELPVLGFNSGKFSMTSIHHIQVL